jgi:hypothetical protein
MTLQVESENRFAARHEWPAGSRIPIPMFEYTALVDAPVKRFTSIVTDPEPDEAPPIIAIAAPAAVPVPETPRVLIAQAPEPAAPFEPAPTAAPLLPAPVLAPAPRVVRTFVPRPEPAPRHSVAPALVAVAAAALTAMWWFRRDSHHTS